MHPFLPCIFPEFTDGHVLCCMHCLHKASETPCGGDSPLAHRVSVGYHWALSGNIDNKEFTMACSLGTVVHNPDETITVHLGIGKDVADKYVVDETGPGSSSMRIDLSTFYKLYGLGPIPTKATPQSNTTSNYGWITLVLLLLFIIGFLIFHKQRK